MTTNSPHVSALAKQLRAMSFENLFDLLLLVYITALHILQRVSITHSIIKKIVKDAKFNGMTIGMDSLKNVQKGSPKKDGESPTMRRRRKTLDEDDDLDASGLDAQNLNSNEWATSPQDLASAEEEASVFESLIGESLSVLASASDLAHVRCAKLIGVRSEQNAKLNPNDFFKFFGATWEFVHGAENITGRLCFGLKGTLLSQV